MIENAISWAQTWECTRWFFSKGMMTAIKMDISLGDTQEKGSQAKPLSKHIGFGLPTQ